MTSKIDWSLCGGEVAGKSGKNMNGSKTLSKEAMYTALVAYNQTETKNAQEYMRRMKVVPESIKESSLISFISHVGREAHSQYSKSFQHVSRITSDEIQSRLQAKTITLVGGGINKAYNSRAAAAAAASKRRKRNRQQQKSAERFDFGQWTDNAQVRGIQVDFIRSLNQHWNSYAWKLFGGSSGRREDESNFIPPAVGKEEQNPKPSPLLSQQIDANAISVFRQLVPLMELIGAKIRVDQCRQHPQYEGRTGILIKESSEVWTVIVIVEEERSENHTNNSTPTIRSLLVPKKRTAITLLLPLVNQSCSSYDKRSDRYIGIQLQGDG